MAVVQVPRAFVMADIAGSARLWNRYPERMSEALARHDAFARDAVRAADGDIFKHTGDGFLATFADVPAAVDAMTAYQHALGRNGDAQPIELRSRVCIHWGAAEQRDNDWFGPALNHLARLTDLVAPTHVVLSAPAAEQLDATRGLAHLGAFSVRDVPDPVSLFAVDVPDGIGPALAVSAGSGLPQYNSAFVGRDDDMRAVQDLLGRYRLVAIVAFGGMGKTRLAVEVAQHWVSEQHVRGHFVDLTATDDPIAAVAEAVGIPDARIAGITAADIAKHLGNGPTLLVLDNCEHIVDAAAETASSLLAAAPEVRVLATSREALEVDGEAIHALGALDADAAVDLLRERAAANGAPALTDLLAHRLCEQVERMPLGVELVVARLRHVDANELADALDESLDELRLRRRGASDRQSTMRSLIAWSYDLCSEPEQTLLLRLAQLPAPWPRAAASSMSGDLPPDTLDGLVAKSMVTTARAGLYRVLEPIRQYCADVLAAEPARADAVRGVLVAWACHTVPAFPGHDPVVDLQATRALIGQLPNVRAGLDAAMRIGDVEGEAAIMIGLWPLVADGRARGWFGPQVDATLSRTTDPAQQRPLIRLALQDTTEHHVDVAREERLLAQLRAIEPQDEYPAESASVHLGRIVRQIVVDRVLGLDPTATREALRKCADVARENGNRLDYSIAMMFTSFSYNLHGEYAEAFALAEEAAELAREVNFVSVAALADASAALAAQARGDVDTALRIAGAATSLAEDARWETSVYAVHAWVLAQAGRHDEARAAATCCVDIALEQLVPFVISDAVIALAAAQAATGDDDGAAQMLDHAGIARTPLTIALMYEVAAGIGLDLGFERFAESLDSEAVDRRAARAAEFLRGTRLA